MIDNDTYNQLVIKLNAGEIGRVKIYSELGLSMTEPLPSHPDLSEEQQKSIISMDQWIRCIVYARLHKQRLSGNNYGYGVILGDVLPSSDGWRVIVLDNLHNPIGEELLSADLAAEASKWFDKPGSNE